MIYRTEHPKPQFMRKDWLNLNGEWQFELDPGVSGESRELYKSGIAFSKTINVPFCVESKLSNVGHTDFINSVWYKREIEITDRQLQNCVILHFGAVDYMANVYINGEKCGSHAGGYVSFSFDITEYLKEGVNEIVVNALDNTRDEFIPTGKQSEKYNSYGCFYTRTTGIWQTVWLEFVPKTRVKKAKYVTDVENGILNISADLVGSAVFEAEAFYNGNSMGKASVKSNGGHATLNINLKEKHLWEIGNGRLYDLVLTYGEDVVESYFGLRSLKLDGYKFLINGKSVFQRLILDQGFYPDGIYTAPSDDELIADIDRSIAMGFNGARLHEKVFEERFLYHCDKKGYMVWGEYPNWGLDHTNPKSIYGILPEWLEEIERDFNHPAIVGWCPFNETWDKNGTRQYDDLISMIYKVTKAVDSTRPCIDTSGNFHVMTDIYDVHDYEQNPENFKNYYTRIPEGIVEDQIYRKPGCQERQKYDGKSPVFISEYGGIRWSEDKSGWGYGNAPTSEEEFLQRLKGLTDILMDNKYIMGICYTQLTDVEQEQNGLYTYQRKPKFPPETIRKIFERKAAIED